MQNREITYKEAKVFKFHNAVVNVFIPELAEEERNARLKEVKNAAECVLKSVQRINKGEINNVSKCF